VVIVHVDECVDPDDAFGSRPVFHHYGMLPAVGKPFREQAGPDIDRAAGTGRHDQVDRSLWPSFRAGR